MKDRETPRKEREQAVRMRRYLMAAGSSFMVVGLIALCWWQGILDLAPSLRASTAIIFLVVVFYLAFRTGWNLRFADPSLTKPQIVVAARVLENAGHRVRVAGDGAQALEAVRHERVDLVLMDVQMPVLGGLEATMALRESERASGRARIPVIAMTANAMQGDRERCLAAGMDDYISKPMVSEQLRAAIERVIARAAAEPPLKPSAE